MTDPEFIVRVLVSFLLVLVAYRYGRYTATRDTERRLNALVFRYRTFEDQNEIWKDVLERAKDGRMMHYSNHIYTKPLAKLPEYPQPDIPEPLVIDGIKFESKQQAWDYFKRKGHEGD